jgi:hypothetical protein
LRELLRANSATYGYTLEVSETPLDPAQLDSVFGRLYRIDGSRHPHPIDVMIFSQAEGDWNITGNPVIAGADRRMRQINAHVRGGGGLILTHAAGGREIARDGWLFGAKLMTDWFQDEYYASSSLPGNGGQFPDGTSGTVAFDEQTLPERDSSAWFVRKLMVSGKDMGGFGKPSSTDQVKGEWYHFNAGYKYEGHMGIRVTNPRNRSQTDEVRGHPGIPDSGIGPSKIFGSLPAIQGAQYVPPAPGRPFAWGREVSQGTFDGSASSRNGRFAYFQPGHSGNVFIQADGWLGDFYLALLRWVAKDDRGCTKPWAPNYDAMATVDDGSCDPVGLDRRTSPQSPDSGPDPDSDPGRITIGPSAIRVAFTGNGRHTVEISDLTGRHHLKRTGFQAEEAFSGLPCGVYLVRVAASGKPFTKRITAF